MTRPEQVKRTTRPRSRLGPAERAIAYRFGQRSGHTHVVLSLGFGGEMRWPPTHTDLEGNCGRMPRGLHSDRITSRFLLSAGRFEAGRSPPVHEIAAGRK